MNIAVASVNPLKVKGVRDGFCRFFPGEEVYISSYDVPSGLGKRQPIESEIFNGAENRLKSLVRAVEEEAIDYFVAVQSGLATHGKYWFSKHVVIIRRYDGVEVAGESPAIMLPADSFIEIVNEDLAIALEKSGGLSALSHNLLTRRFLIDEGVIAALSGFNWK